MRHPLLKTLRQLWWLPLACTSLAWFVGKAEFVRELAWHSLDWRTRFRLDFQPPPDPRLVVVLFEDATEALLEKTWPVDRQYHMQMTQVLALADARVVAWDVILDRSWPDGKGDELLGQIAAAANEAGVAVLSAAVTNPKPTGATPGREGPTKPLPHVVGDIRRLAGADHADIPFPQLRDVSLYGFADMQPGSDGIGREVPLVVRVGQEVYPHLSLQIVLAYFGVKIEDVQVRLGDAVRFKVADRAIRIPIDAAGKLLLNYRYDQTGHATDLPVLSYGTVLYNLSEVYLEEKKPSHPPPDLKGKIVILGQTVTGMADAGPSQLRNLTPRTFGVANAINNILTDDYARTMPGWLVWPVVLLIGYFWVLLVANRAVLLMCLGAILIDVGYTSVALWSWVWFSWWVPLVAPLGGFAMLQFVTIGWRVWQEQKAKQEIQGMFGSYVSPEIVDRMIKADEKPRLGGHEEEITAYFSDIQAYSTFSEKLPPNLLVELLNEYLTVCTDAVHEQGGTLDKYIGDAVVAIYGAPIALPDHAYRACLTALHTQERLGALREKWSAAGDVWPEGVRKMRTRIGLNSGPAIIGNMGSRTRFSYTMTGDNVNLAARMESGAKSWGAYTMCTEATKLACEQHGGARVVFRPLGRTVVMGRSHPVPVFEVVDLKENIAPRTLEGIAVFEAALASYYARDWEGALAGFKRSAELEFNVPGVSPGVKNNPSLVYLEIVNNYLREPPSESWDGVYVMGKK